MIMPIAGAEDNARCPYLWTFPGVAGSRVRRSTAIGMINNLRMS